MATFKELFDRARQSDAYWAEKAILEFTGDIYAEMKRQGKSYSDLARILNTSPAYITKVFRGNANFTIQSMVKLSRALGCRFHARAIHENAYVSWFHTSSINTKGVYAGSADNYRPLTVNEVSPDANNQVAA